ncbi:class I SAM-dependent methyltransferase [Lutimonas saemankumensis]|uniref:class I SAM-dependent methyltransferase n=1 Tax=Lutimonas saemankumensis TaxID=483016 RepID=UPI001CD6161F|nr:class I SAM-dependent methyltransferase [Lutimonas saemankumensis]MCA0932947.1 class I SAM-dependent methyltransferase [Lutimonas saemankumensis]
MSNENSGLEPYVSKENLKPFLKCLDYTVSRETFELLIDPETELLVTFPRPSEKDLPAYYESEEYISHTDSTKSLMDKVYQMVKSYSIKRKLKLVNSNTSQKGKILDVGCGTGDFLEGCLRDQWKVTGIEPNPKATVFAEKKVGPEGRLFRDIKEIKEDEYGSYDVITMWHVLEHVPNLLEYIDLLKNLLKKDGCLIIAVPNYQSYDAKYYNEFWAAYDVPRHLWHFSQKSIHKLFSAKNFEVVKTLPLIFDSFYVSLLSEKYKYGSSNLIRAFKTGLMSNLKARSSGNYSSLIYLLKNS